MRKNRIRLSEGQLRGVIKESVYRILNEQIARRRQNLFESILNEGMEFPCSVRRIWWDGDETFMVLGDDNRWYNVYPTYGDAYLEDSADDKVFKSYVDKIKQAYINNGLKPDVFLYNLGDKPMIIDETNGGSEFFDKLNFWLEDKGFILKDARGGDNDENVWEYTGEYGDDSENEDKLNKVSGMKDVTNEVGDLFQGEFSPKQASMKALSILKDNF